MTKDKPPPSIVVCYYDMREIEKQNPKELAQRCCGEIVALCEQLRLATQHLASAARRQEITDAIRLCEYYYEDAIARIYILRERSWDALAPLVNISRRQTGDKQFRQSVLARLGTDYPELRKAFEKLLTIIDPDLKNRNVSTHQTFLFLGITLIQDFRDTYEIDSVLMWRDPESLAGREIQAMVRKALNRFVSQETKKFRETTNQALEVEKLCFDAIRKKSW